MLELERWKTSDKEGLSVKQYQVERHVVPHQHGWAVQKSGTTNPSHVLPTKREAVKVGRALSRKEGAELVIHRQDGRIQARYSYEKPQSSSAQGKVAAPSQKQRIFDLHPGAMIMSEDFDDELPDEFWLGKA